MAGVSNMMQGFGDIASAITQAQAQKLQGEWQKQMYDTNAKYATIQADDAIRRGDKTASNYQKQVAGLVGEQRAVAAANGVEVNSGSALDVQADTKAQGAVDVLTIKNNAWREAFGYRANANMMSSQGAIAQNAANFGAASTLLTGGLNAAGSFAKAGYEFNKAS